MCQHNDKIQATVDEFVGRNEGFTSVDIANTIKRAGTWVANRDVARWLRNWVPTLGYGVTRTTVELADGNQVQASVYLPSTMSVSDYTATSQTAMTPQEFEQLHGFNPVAAPAPYNTGADPDPTLQVLVTSLPADNHGDGTPAPKSDDGQKLGAKLKRVLNKTGVFNFPKPN